jgi:hypothetical protein
MQRNLEEIEWNCHSETEDFLTEKINHFVNNFPEVLRFKGVLKERTSIRLNDLIEFLILNNDADTRTELFNFGFKEMTDGKAPEGLRFRHPGSIFPDIILSNSGLPDTGLQSMAIKVEDIALFHNFFGVSSMIEGNPLSMCRMALIWKNQDMEFWVIEQRGGRHIQPVDMPSDFAGRYLECYQRWLTRRRQYENSFKGMEQTLKLARELVSDIGPDMAAWIAFAAERCYWQQKNKAGQIQRMRQDALGLGWANHDHHTFRSSRAFFPQLIKILQTFGFELREKFYAGSEAGWGAQVLEQPNCNLVVFADVDLSPEELKTDFAGEPLSERKEKGTVGLWCALHGESILEAGLHHLACKFEFDRLQDDLERERILLLPSFSDFPFLRQAFTKGERWMVDNQKLVELKNLNLIHETELIKWKTKGSVGSHMENIERNQGFKGFNEESVSDIIRRTDPRLDFGAA